MWREVSPVWREVSTVWRDFTCSVSEFTSSTGSIHVNSPVSVNTLGVSTRIYREIMSFSHDDTCQ